MGKNRRWIFPLQFLYWGDDMALIGKFPLITVTNPKNPPRYTYTGQSELIKGPDIWKIKFVTSGVFTLLSPTKLGVDVFLVGGGGGGFGSGGGGGYTTNGVTILQKGVDYKILIPSGGVGGESATDGGTCTAFGFVAAGGGKGGMDGGDGGSGGGALNNRDNGGSGGSDGVRGSNGMHYSLTLKEECLGGTGQIASTREFGEPSGVLYSGGGGGYGLMAFGEGGAGGGGNGGTGDRNWTQPAESATYYGGGGGGVEGLSGSGYQGIAIIRNHLNPHSGSVIN